MASWSYVEQAAREWYDLAHGGFYTYDEDTRERFSVYAAEEARERDSLDVHLPTLWRIFENREEAR
jgi:hypothetical protein